MCVFPSFKKGGLFLKLTRGWLAGCRTRRVDAPRPPLHREAIHAPPNSTALPLSLLAAPPLLLTRGPSLSLLFFLFLSLSALSSTKAAVAVVSSGVVIATLSRPRASASAQPTTTTTPAADTSRYAIGVAMLLVSLVCTGAHGVLQEHTFSTYGPHWREGVFYMVR